MTAPSPTLLISSPFFPPFLMSLVSHLQLWVFSFLYGFGFLIHLFFPFRLLFQTSLSWWLKKPSWRLNTGKVSSPNNISAVHCIFIMMVPWITMIRKHNQSGPQPGKRGHDRPLFSFCRDCSVHQWCVLCERGFDILGKWCSSCLCLPIQGRGATCCVHLPGPNGLRLERKRTLAASGARTGGPLLRWRMHTEVRWRQCMHAQLFWETKG